MSPETDEMLDRLVRMRRAVEKAQEDANQLARQVEALRRDNEFLRMELATAQRHERALAAGAYA